MSSLTMAQRISIPANFSYVDHGTKPTTVADLVFQGLSQRPKRLPAALLYDANGARLFERICRTPEYYLPRVEASILERHRADLAPLVSGRTIIEYGAGEMSKVRLLMRAALPYRYIAVDVAGDQLMHQGFQLARDHPTVLVDVIHADYRDIDLAPGVSADRSPVLFFFPGSSFGNFEPFEAEEFLRHALRLVGPEGTALIGVDSPKQAGRLHRAYNDEAGCTAAFNLNLLKRLNRELSADFRIDRFDHDAFYDSAHGRIEMHLRSRTAQTVTVGQRRFHFAEGESIHTENSYKYLPEQMKAMALRAGFEEVRMWSDDVQDFGVFVLESIKKTQ